LAIKDFKSMARNRGTTSSTAGMVAENLGLAVNESKSAAGTVGTQALTAEGAASWRAEIPSDRALAFAEDASYSIKMTDIEKE